MDRTISGIGIPVKEENSDTETYLRGPFLRKNLLILRSNRWQVDRL